MPDLRPRLSSAEAGPLIDALRDASPECRLAALDALTRLPLDRDCWLAVRRYVAWALQDATSPEHLGVIPLAARVPVASVRGALRVMTGSANADERREAALALGAVRDSAAVEALVALLDEPGPDVEAARLLARNDVAANAEELGARCSTLAPVPRFWVALALARAGDDGELVRFLQELGSGAFAFELLWGDPSLVLEELAAGSPLPDATVIRVREAAGAEGDAAKLAGLIAEASVVEPEPPPAAAPAPPAPWR